MDGYQPAAARLGELANRWPTVSDDAEFVGCHEETVRRAYLRGLFNSTRFDVKGRRFHPRVVSSGSRRGFHHISPTYSPLFRMSPNVQMRPLRNV